MEPFKTKAYINSLHGEQDEITVLEKIEKPGRQPYFIVDYRGSLCTAIFNCFVCAYFTDDIYGIID